MPGIRASRWPFCALVVCALILPASRTRACPSSLTLGDMVGFAPIVVVGTLMRIDLRTTPDGDSAVEVIRIDEILKSALPLPRVMEIPTHWDDPSEPGASALLFLHHDEESGSFAPLWIKDLDDRERLALGARIRELVDIFQETDAARRASDRLEWAIRCAEDPATLYYGLEELCRSPDYTAVAEDQRERLFGVLRRSDGDDTVALVGLAELLAPSRDPRVLEWLQDRLARTGDDTPSLTGALMNLVADFLDWDEGRRLCSAFADTEDHATEQDIAGHFRAGMYAVAYDPEGVSTDSDDADADSDGIEEEAADEADDEAVYEEDSGDYEESDEEDGPATIDDVPTWQQQVEDAGEAEAGTETIQQELLPRS